MSTRGRATPGAGDDRPRETAGGLRRGAAEKIRPETQRDLVAPSRPQDEFDVRAKSSGHGKKTADKWNQ